MATRLYRTLQFQGLVVGVPASLPHNINIDDRPLVPHFVVPEVGGFVVTADAINVTITRLPGAPAFVDVWVMMLHTYLRAFNADVDLSVRPFVVDPGSAIATSSPSNCLIYQPGGPNNGPVIFNDWNSLYGQLLILRAQANGGGCYIIEFDDEFATPVVVPAGTYDMVGCTWIGSLDPTPIGALQPVQVNLADGVVLQSLYEYRAIDVRSLSAVTSPVTLATNEVYYIHDRARISALAAAPYFSGSPASATLYFYDDATLGDFVNAAIAIGGLSTIQLSMGESARVFANALAVPFGSILSVVWRATSADIDGTQPGMLGTYSQQNQVVDRWRVRTTAAASIAVAFGDQIGYTPPLAGGTVTLPTITRFSSGQPVSVKRLASPNALVVTPAGGQTIDGVASLSLAGLQAVILVPDGTTNWRVIADTSSRPRYSPPEKWNQQNVAASQVGVPLSGMVSIDFDNIQAIRAGSIVGLSSRFTEVLTAGTATVQVTVNGALGTLTVVSTAVSNQDGGVNTQAFGIDNYVAGDLLGIAITTDAGFLPITTDVEAWLQVEDAA